MVALDMRIGLIDPLQDDRYSGSWHKVEFNPPMSGKKVAVFTETQTHRGPDTPGIRIKDVDNYGFKIRFDEVTYHNIKKELIESDGWHDDETVAWVAYSF